MSDTLPKVDTTSEEKYTTASTAVSPLEREIIDLRREKKLREKVGIPPCPRCHKYNCGYLFESLNGHGWYWWCRTCNESFLTGDNK